MKAVLARDFTDTWQGLITSQYGSMNVDVAFSLDGNPLYSYTNNKGVWRQVELTRIGQKVEYVPAGGGVQTVIVQSISKRLDRVTLSLTVSFEKASSAISISSAKRPQSSISLSRKA
jgi:hypothetical protein